MIAPPKMIPPITPIVAMSAASTRNCARMRRPFMPMAARMPISRVLSKTDMTSVFETTVAVMPNTMR